MSESQIQRAILDYLAARHIFAVRMNSGTQVRVDGGKRRAIHMNAAGTADILAFPWANQLLRATGNNLQTVWAVQPTWIEVKAPKGIQSEFQKSFQAQVEREGHLYAICRSVDEVEDLLK